MWKLDWSPCGRSSMESDFAIHSSPQGLLVQLWWLVLCVPGLRGWCSSGGCCDRAAAAVLLFLSDIWFNSRGQMPDLLETRWRRIPLEPAAQEHSGNNNNEVKMATSLTPPFQTTDRSELVRNSSKIQRICQHQKKKGGGHARGEEKPVWRKASGKKSQWRYWRSQKHFNSDIFLEEATLTHEWRGVYGMGIHGSAWRSLKKLEELFVFPKFEWDTEKNAVWAP